MTQAAIDLPDATTTLQQEAPLRIFVHRASECLTDHLPHGDGLICYSLLGELSRRGHHIIAYTNRNGVTHCPANLDIREQTYKIPANSLGDWELGIRANRLLAKIERTEKIDLVWRMHPYQGSSPIVPYTGGRPLVIGPLFLGWPKESAPVNDLGKPRFGIGIRGILGPLALRGWTAALKKAALVICATDSLSSATRALTDGTVLTLPVIVESPVVAVSSVGSLLQNGEAGVKTTGMGRPKLIFAANLYRNKNPLVFCQTIAKLRAIGIPAVGEVIGDGPERPAMQQWCSSNNVEDAVGFLGRLPNTEVYQHLALADGLISTSLGEPYGRSIAEAMSVGAVPICHRSGGPADFISHGIDGLLIDHLDSHDYAKAIAAAWGDPAIWKKLSETARCKARDWRTEVVVNNLEKALYTLLRRGAAK